MHISNAVINPSPHKSRLTVQLLPGTLSRFEVEQDIGGSNCRINLFKTPQQAFELELSS